MKTLGLALALALGAAAWQAAEDNAVVTAGIDGGGSAADRSNCILADSDRLGGCEGDELRPGTIAGIDGRGSAADRSDCVQAESDRLNGCESDELRPIVVAGISGTG